MAFRKRSLFQTINTKILHVNTPCQIKLQLFFVSETKRLIIKAII